MLQPVSIMPLPVSKEILANYQMSERAKSALEGAQPLSQNGYKVPLTQALVKRAVAKLNA